MALGSLNITIPKGTFVCIIGEVGSGKSSLLSALIGDMLYLDSNHMPTTTFDNISDQSQKPLQPGKSPIIINETMSYVQQMPWIQNKTIKENILFGNAFDKYKYDRVISICELTRDLEILPSGD